MPVALLLSSRAPTANVLPSADRATFVGSVRVTFDELVTNRVAAGRTRRDYRDRAFHLEKGEEWGRFEFGSTIVLLAEPGVLELAAQAPGSELRLGARIGTLYATERQL